MTRWIEVAQGEFYVQVDPVLWQTVKLTWALRGIPWDEYLPESDEPLPEPIEFLDFLMITATCPCPEHMDALARELGFNP